MADGSDFACCVCLEEQPLSAQCLLTCGHGPCRACTLLLLKQANPGGLACPLCRRVAPSTCTLRVAVFETPSRVEELEGVSVFASREDVLERIASDARVDASRVRDLTVQGSYRFKPHTTLLENAVCCGDSVMVAVLFKKT